MINNEILEEIIQYLQGTCKTLNEAVQTVTDEEYNEDDLTDEQKETIDNEIFSCACCGWWYEVGEMSEAEDENICIECNND